MYAREIKASFRITAMLYLIVLLLSVGFYYIYNAFDTIQLDTKTMHRSGEIRGMTEHAVSPFPKDTALQIHQALLEIKPWILKRQHSDFYNGRTTLLNDYEQTVQCWEEYISASAKNRLPQQCISRTRQLDNIITHIVYPEQKTMDNMLYLILVISLFLILYLIYFIRLYITIQMKKHAIYDHDTHLFNKKYFLAELHTTVERAKREHRPVSMLRISCEQLTEGEYTSKEQKHLAQKIAHILSTLTRESDTVCRYDRGNFIILMSLTDKEAALHLETRIKEALEQHDFHIGTKPLFHFKTIERESDENDTEFIARIL